METAGVVLAIPGVLELCLRYGKYVHGKYQTFRNADEEFSTRILVLEGRWLQIEAQINYLKNMWDRLPDRLQIHFTHVLSWLQTLLLRARTLVDQLISVSDITVSAKEKTRSLVLAVSKEGKLRKGAFALSQKDTLDKLLSELSTWHQDMLGPSWFQLLRLPSALISETQRGAVNVPQLNQLQRLRRTLDQVDGADTAPGRRSSTPTPLDLRILVPIFASEIAVLLQADGITRLLIEEVVLPEYVDRQGTLSNFEKLVQKLNVVDPFAMNLPVCQEAVDPSSHPSLKGDLALLFTVPTDLSSLRSLREVLLEQNPFLPLHTRVSIAVQIATSVMSIHSLNIVHKGIRPETILLFEIDPNKQESRLSTSQSIPEHSLHVLTLGFDQSRAVESKSYLRGDLNWRKALYRHPSRHGLHPEAEYKMQHDIYSLGVCLLEIGLWTSFVLAPGGLGIPRPDIDMSTIRGNEPLRKALMVKERLQKLAGTELPGKMGRRYADVVLSCLGCLDWGNTGFGDQADLEDKDQILVSVRFMEVVLLQLQSIQV